MDKEAEILALNREMETALGNNDLQAVANCYANEAVLVSGGMEISGREAIAAYWLKLKDRAIAWELENV